MYQKYLYNDFKKTQNYIQLCINILKLQQTYIGQIHHFHNGKLLPNY